MAIELYKQETIFRKNYFKNLINRFTNASLGIEGIDGNLVDTIQAMNIYQQTKALEYIFNSDDSNLTIGEIKKIASIITGEAVTDFRTTKAEVIGSNIRRSSAKTIYSDMYVLFDNYYKIWQEL